MVTLCKKHPNSLEPKDPSNAPSALPLPPYPATSHTRSCPTGLYSLQLILGRDRAHVPFRVSEFKEIKKDLGNYIENPEQYIRHLEKSAKTELSWKDVMLLLSQTLTSLEKKWVLDQAITAGDNYHVDKSSPPALSQTGPSLEEGKGE
jgi:hypothetical protein